MTTPYAWAINACSRMWRGEFAEMDAKAEAARCGGTCRAFPLYDHHAPQAKPLTDEQYEELITRITKKALFSWRTFARAIEQAHGIGVKP